MGKRSNHGVNGLLVAPQHAAMLAHRLHHLLGNPALLQAYGIRGTNPYTRVLMTATPFSWLDVYGQFSYSMGQTNVNYTQSNSGEFVNLSSLLFYTSEQDLLMGATGKPVSATSFIRYVEAKYLETTASSAAA